MCSDNIKSLNRKADSSWDAEHDAEVFMCFNKCYRWWHQRISTQTDMDSSWECVLCVKLRHSEWKQTLKIHKVMWNMWHNHVYQRLKTQILSMHRYKPHNDLNKKNVKRQTWERWQNMQLCMTTEKTKDLSDVQRSFKQRCSTGNQRWPYSKTILKKIHLIFLHDCVHMICKNKNKILQTTVYRMYSLHKSYALKYSLRFMHL